MARRRPVTLYKYCPPERIDVLQNGRIRFTPPAVLNDPFEMSPSLVRRWMASDVERAGDMEEASAILHDGFAADQRTAESLRSEVGVLSLAETPDNLLMWAHYADQHRGFLIGLDPAHEFFQQRQSTRDEFHHVRRVRYSHERPSREVHRFVDARTLLTKSLDWKYEREWRMLIHFPRFAHEVVRRRGQVIHLVPLPASCVTSVVLGARMPENQRAMFERLITEQRYRHATVRYAELDTSFFQVLIPTSEYYFERGWKAFDRAMRATLREHASRESERAAKSILLSVVADLSRALRLSPASAKYFVIRALAYQRLNKLEAAISDCTLALESDPGPHADYLHKMRGELFVRLGRLQEAELDFKSVEGDEEAASFLQAVQARLQQLRTAQE